MNARRVKSVESRINRFPYRFEAIDNAYVRFLEDGTLPGDDVLAWRVLKRVLHARKPLPRRATDPSQASNAPLHQPYGTTREMLFREACCPMGPARDLARLLLRAMVQAGYDPTDEELIGPEMEPADFATTSMRLLGWPQDYVHPDYRQQLDRVMGQQAAEAASRPHNDTEWVRGAGQALAAFLVRGVLPEPRFFPFVISTAEEMALHSHYFGRGGEELLAAFETIATGDPVERSGALKRIGQLQVLAVTTERSLS